MDDGRRAVVVRRIGSGAPASPSVSRVDGDGSDDASSSDAGYPLYAVPGMVLLAAVAIFVGYRCLQVIPGGSIRPSVLVFAVCAAPATVALTRHGAAGRSRFLRRCALALAAAVPLLGVILLLDRGLGWARVLGAASLLLAASLLALAAMSERRDRTASPH